MVRSSVKNKLYIVSPRSRVQRGRAALDGQQGRGLPRSHRTRLEAAGGQQVPLRGRTGPRKRLRALAIFKIRVRGQNQNRRHTEERARRRQVREALGHHRTDIGAFKVSRVVYMNHRPSVQGYVREKQQSLASLPRVLASPRMRLTVRARRTNAERTARSSRHSPLRSSEPAPSRSTRGARKPVHAHLKLIGGATRIMVIRWRNLRCDWPWWFVTTPK